MDSIAGHRFHDINHYIGPIGSDQEDSFDKHVAGHWFQTTGNENKDIAQDSVAGNRFCSNGLSKIDCTVKQIEAKLTKLDENKAKGRDGIRNILLKKLARR